MSLRHDAILARWEEHSLRMSAEHTPIQMPRKARARAVYGRIAAAAEIDLVLLRHKAVPPLAAGAIAFGNSKIVFTAFEFMVRIRAMTVNTPRDGAAAAPPPERGRSDRAAIRVGVNKSPKFNRTTLKTAIARRLRRDSTDVEMRLWQRLRNKQLGVDFRRQHPAGPYVLDFYCPALCLAIELDGSQHVQPNQARRDESRTRWLAERKVTLLRYWNSDVTQNLSGVLEDIAAKIAELQAAGLTPTRRWRADLPLSGGGDSRTDRAKHPNWSSRQGPTP